MAGLSVQAMIGVGASQSGMRLVTYIDGVHPLADIFDGFLVHGRAGSHVIEGSQSLSEPPLQTVISPGAARIRADLNVPVLVLMPETFLAEPLYNAAAARQPDSESFRQWETPGTADGDTYLFVTGPGDVGGSPAAIDLLVTSVINAPDGTPIVTCGMPINSGPNHFVANAAVAALDRWVRDGVPPPSAPWIEFDGDQLQRDDHGIAIGGIRTPQVDVPIATLSGHQTGGDFLCVAFGNTVPFDDATLAALYPSHATYFARVNNAADAAVAAGFVLSPDAELIKSAAALSSIGG